MQLADLDLQYELYKVDAVCGCKEDNVSEGFRTIMPIPVKKKIKIKKKSHTNFTQTEKLCYLVVSENVDSSQYKNLFPVQGCPSKTAAFGSEFLQRACGVS